MGMQVTEFTWDSSRWFNFHKFKNWEKVFNGTQARWYEISRIINQDHCRPHWIRPRRDAGSLVRQMLFFKHGSSIAERYHRMAPLGVLPIIQTTAQLEEIMKVHLENR